MSRLTPLLVFLVFLLAACSPQPTLIPATFTPNPSPTSTTLPTETAQLTPALQISTETPTGSPSPTLLPLTAPTMDPLVATSAAQLGPMGALTNISQYYHPVGTPVTTWRDIPVMKQATAGQEYPPYVYSYTANATLEQARQYYAPVATSLGIVFLPGSGTAGTGSNAVHNVTFLSPSPEIVIVLTSFDNDPSHVIVVFAKAP